MLAVSDLHVSYGRIPALRGVSLNVHEGEVVGLIGANGAGKTSTLSTIVGLLAPTQGGVHFQGTEITRWSPERIARAGIGLVPEGRQIFATLSVAENLELGLTARRERNGHRRDLELVLERFPILGHHYRSSAGQLSGGEQQQLAIARALVSRPTLLLLDEPSLGLAPQMVDLVFDVLGDLRNEGRTILLVEQNAVRTVDFANRTYVMRTGQVVAQGDNSTLSDLVEATSAYMGTSP